VDRETGLGAPGRIVEKLAPREVDWNQVFRVAYRCCVARGMQHADAEDLAQEACLRCLAGQRRRDLMVAVPLIRKTTRDLVVDWHRQKVREKKRFGPSIVELTEEACLAHDPRLSRVRDVEHQLLLRKARLAGATPLQVSRLSWGLVAYEKRPLATGLASIGRLVGLTTREARELFLGLAMKMQLI
jgi:hypothetical protein